MKNHKGCFKSKKEKPRVRFCWECGKKLWGNHFTEELVEGHQRIFHKSCLKWRNIDNFKNY